MVLPKVIMNKAKLAINRILDKPDNDTLGTVIGWFILILIILSVISVILETIHSLYMPFKLYFELFEFFTITIFTIEYLLRFWSCDADSKYSGFIGRLKYTASFMAIVDLLAILPFYIPFFISLDLRFLRIIRIMRMFRLIKITRYSNAISEAILVIKSRKEHLIITLTVIMILLILISGIMYSVEYDAQPDAFYNIPQTMWWAICTMTTVGYGDIFPITPLGKFLAGIISLLGVGLFAVPVGIISSGFVEVMDKDKKAPKKCPHYGKDLT